MTHDEVEKWAVYLEGYGMPEAAALIRRLRDERDEARNKAEELLTQLDQIQSVVFRSQEVNNDLTAELEKAKEVLEPFATAEAAKAAKGVWIKRRGTITTKDTLEDAIDDTIVLDRALLRAAARFLA